MSYPLPPDREPSPFLALVDFRFERLVSRRLISVAYAIMGALTVLGGLAALAFSFVGGVPGFLVALVLVPAATFVQLLILRVVAEVAATYFRVADDVQELRRAAASTS